MSRRPTEPRAGTLSASVLAHIRRGPIALREAAAALHCTEAQVFRTLMRLRSELRHNIATLGQGRYELLSGVFPARPGPRSGSRAARVLGRLRVCPVNLRREAARVRCTPGQVLRSINALRVQWDLNIRLVGPGTYELRPGRYSERGYWGRQRGALTLAVLEQLRADGVLDVHETAMRTGHAPRRILSALTSLRRDHAITSVGRGRYALINAPSQDAA